MQKLQADYRRRVQTDAHLFHALDTREALEASVLKLRSDLVGLRRSAKQWAAAVAILLLLIVGVGVWLVRSQTAMTSEMSKLRQGILQYAQTEAQLRKSENAVDANALQQKVYDELSKKLGLEVNVLREKLPRVAADLKRAPDASSYERASAAYVTMDYPEAERLSKQAVDEARKIGSEHEPQASKAAELAGLSAQKRAEGASMEKSHAKSTSSASPIVLAQTAATPISGSINLLAADNGGQLIVAPDANWAGTIDGKEDQLYWFNPQEEAVFGFKDDSTAMFDAFSVLIPNSDPHNVKEFELLAGDGSPTGDFHSIGKFSTQNVRMMKTGGYQEFKFAPITAKYLKVRLLASHGTPNDSMYLYEFRLSGRLVLSTGRETSASPVNAANNLLAAENGGAVVVAPNENWSGTIDGKEDQLYWFNPQDEAVYGFKDEQAATFDTFAILIPNSDLHNVKEFELLAGNDSPMGDFHSIGKFQTQNIRMMKTDGFQEFKFPPVTAKYLKVKLLASHGPSNEAMYLYEFRLFGPPRK